MSWRRALGVAVLGAGVLLGAVSCASSAPHPTAPAQARDPLEGWHLLRSVPVGFSVRLPPGVRSKESREGPVRARLWSSASPDGTNFEVASFDLPETLEPADRRVLLARIVAGLGRRPGARVLSATATTTAGEKSLDLRMELLSRSRGAWRIFYAGDRMFQVSAVGPMGGGERQLQAFFASFQLEGERYRAPGGEAPGNGVGVPASEAAAPLRDVSPGAALRRDAP